MFLQFLTPKGHPAYVLPDQVVALAGYHTTGRDGRPALATRLVLTNGELVFLLGDCDAIKDAIETAVNGYEVVDPSTGETV